MYRGHETVPVQDAIICRDMSTKITLLYYKGVFKMYAEK